MGRQRWPEAERFEEYLGLLSAAIGHADRREPLRAYLTGLLLAGERKSIEPMAARVDPGHVSMRHQSMHHFVANAPWDESAVLAVAREYALSQLERHGPVAAWVLDDSGYPKKGKHSVGVARQYCGPLGKQDNCQVAVTLSLVNPTMSVPCAYRLYLPEAWAKDQARRRAAGVPEQIAFQTKPELALAQVDQLLADGLPRAPLVADAGYGSTTEFREGVSARGLSYAMGIMRDTTVWPQGHGPLPPPPHWGGRGRPARHLRRDPDHQPLSVRTLARGLDQSSWQVVRWREGTKGAMQSRFAMMSVRPAHRDDLRDKLREAELLLVEWPAGESEPTRCWLSTLPHGTDLKEVVGLAKIRWRIERDYQELKDEIGLDHYEGRGWRGFHHHGALCIAAYAFLAAERARLSPPAPVAFLRAAPLPKGFRPRGAAGAS
jgi:SRSO17 transposase